MNDATSITRILLVFLLAVASSAGAQELWQGTLGSEIGIPTTHEVETSEIGEGLMVQPLGQGSSLVPSTIKGRLSAVRSAPQPNMRGAKEARLYSELSPRVVMVVTNSGVGSGALIGDPATVLTNWHVIDGYDEVGVIYKPAAEGQQVTKADLRRASVVRIDEVSDLALLRVQAAPPDVGTIELGVISEVPVGSDVHAIGHPTGESWTYTKGFVSQVRQNYEWVTESGKVHQADVVQTQTPINPGNSGGPLLSDNYNLVGVNSFKSSGEALNFAVSVDEVRRFLARNDNRYAKAAAGAGSSVPVGECDIQWMGSEVSIDPPGTKYFADVDCDGNVDGFRMVPNDPQEPIWVSLDTTGNDLIDTIFVDTDRDGGVDLSYYDTDGDNKPDLVGYHRNGDATPYTYEELN